MTPAANEDKPRLRLDPCRPGVGKWECFSEHNTYDGRVHLRQGKGYSPLEAYQRWVRCSYPSRQHIETALDELV